MSGEAYMNFGIPAVILLGLLVGSIMKFMDMRIKESISLHPHDVRVYAYTLLALAVGAFVDSVNFSTLYTVAALLVLSVAMIVASRYIKLPLG